MDTTALLASRVSNIAARLDNDGDEWGVVAVLREAATRLRAVAGEPADLERFRPAVVFWRAHAEFAVDVESIGRITFKQPVEEYRARVAEADSLLRLIDGCDCPGKGKADPRLHAPNCPARTARHPNHEQEPTDE